MPFVDAPGTAKVEILAHHTVTMIPIVNVLHIVSPNPYTGSFVADAAAAIVTWANAHTNSWAVEWVGEAVRVTDLSTVDGAQFTDTGIAGTLGTQGTGAPASICALVKLLTAERSRSGRGRIFFSPIDSGSVDTNGAISSGVQGDYMTNIAALQTALAGIESFASGLCVLSRATGIAHPVTTYLCEALAASQRRRIGR